MSQQLPERSDYRRWNCLACRLVGVPAPRTQPLAILQPLDQNYITDSVTYTFQNKRQRDKHEGNEPERSRRPADAQALQHAWRSERECTPKRAAEEGVARKDARDMSRVRLAEIVEDGLKRQIEAWREEAGADDGHDPVDAGHARLAKSVVAVG